MNNVLIVANFIAGRKQAIKYKKRIQKFLLIRQVYFRFVSIDQLNEVEMKNFDTILVVGGDGTVNKVLPYLINTNKTLGIIPCGTANLLASNLGINNVTKALKVIDKENNKDIDVLSINNKYSVLRCGFGYDANIICKTPQSLKNKFGYFAYFIAGIIFALRLKKEKYFLSLDNINDDILASCIIVANAANMYRSLFSVADNSKIDDGFLDIFILKTTNLFGFVKEFLRIALGIAKDSKNARYIKTKELKIRNYNRYLRCHIDGEKEKLDDKVIRLKVLPKAIKVFC